MGWGTPIGSEATVAVVQSLSSVQLFETPWTVARQTSLSFTISLSLLKLMSLELVMPAVSSSVVPFSSCPQSFLASGSFPISQLFTSGGQSTDISASVSVLPMNISFRIDWFDLLAVQVTLKSLLQHHSSKVSILWDSAFFMVQLSHTNKTTGKPIALTIQTFVSKVMSLLFNTLSRFFIVFLPRSK